MDSQRITESSQHVTRGGSALSQVLSAALCDVYAHRDNYELSEYSENGLMVVVAEDAYFSIVFFQMTEPLGWDGLELLRGPDYWRYIPDKVIVHLDFKGLRGGCISERLCQGFEESTQELEDLLKLIGGICAWQSGLPRSRGRSGYGWEYPHYVPCDVLICGRLRHLKIVQNVIEELYPYAGVHIASDEDPTAAVEPHVRAWFERAIDDWLEGLADDGPTHVLPGARPCP